MEERITRKLKDNQTVIFILSFQFALVKSLKNYFPKFLQSNIVKNV